MWYTWGVLAAGRDCTTTTIANHLNDLEDVGLLTRELRHRDQVGGTRYWLELPPIKEIWRAVTVHTALIYREGGLSGMDKFELADALGPIPTREEIESEFERFWDKNGQERTAQWDRHFGRYLQAANRRREFIERRRDIHGYLNRGLPNAERTPVKHLRRQMKREER